MVYTVSEYHRQLMREADALLDRIGMHRLPGNEVLSSDAYLLLVPVLHAILGRLDALEQRAALKASTAKVATDAFQPTELDK